jgi:hypothetical protein
MQRIGSLTSENRCPVKSAILVELLFLVGASQRRRLAVNKAHVFGPHDAEAITGAVPASREVLVFQPGSSAHLKPLRFSPQNKANKHQNRLKHNNSVTSLITIG